MECGGHVQTGGFTYQSRVLLAKELRTGKAIFGTFLSEILYSFIHSTDPVLRLEILRKEWARSATDLS